MKNKIATLINCYIAIFPNRGISNGLSTKQFNNLTVKQLLSGQALVTLLVFVAAATIITGAAITITILNSQTTSKFALGEDTLQVAESGVEYAIARLLQNPNYAGETLTVDVGKTAQISVSGSSPKTITSTGQIGNFFRKVQVVGTISNYSFTSTSWTQID